MIHGKIDRHTDGQTDGHTGVLMIHGQTDGHMDGQTDGHTRVLMTHGQTHGHTDGQTDRQTDRWTHLGPHEACTSSCLCS